MVFESLVKLQEESCKKFANNPAFGTLDSGSWIWTTYGEFSQLVDQLRAGLASLGVGAGDKVAIVSRNRLEWATAAYATWGLGAVFVPMYEAQLWDERKFILQDCGAKLVFASTEGIAKEMADRVGDLESLERAIALDAPESDDNSYAKLLAKGAEEPTPPADVKPEDVACFLYTSGTTGQPKGVILTHSNICHNVDGANQRFDFTSSDRALCFLPWAHAFGQTAELHTLLSQGCQLAINDEVPNLINNLPVVKPTVLVAVPRIFNRIYDGVNKQMAAKPAPIRKLFAAGIRNASRKSQGEHLGPVSKLALSVADRIIFEKVRQKFGGRLRFVVSGSAALSPDVAKFIDALGIDVYEGYGMTETSPVLSANYPGHRKFGSVGPAFPHVKLEIDMSATDDPKSGEIVASGPVVMQGYHNRPEETAQAFTPDGRIRTGDMGYLDEDGFLWITGRIKEQYKLENGKYVVPAILEEQLKLSPFVANVMLYGANKPHNVALVVVDKPELERWAQENGKQLGDIANNQEVKDLILGELEKYSGSAKSYERPRAVALIDDDFTTENGMLTPKLSLKRRVALEKYSELLEALYG